MDRDILVLEVVSVDYEEGSLQVKEIITLKHLSQLRIFPGMSTQKGKIAAALRAVFPRGLPDVPYQPGGTLQT